MSIAQWQRLEARVQHLETWAGPGQVQALLDGQQGLRADMAKVQATLGRHERLLTRLKTDVAKLKQTQDQHTAILEQHSAILEQHSAILEQHTAILEQHTAILERHSAMLGQHSEALGGLTADMAWVKRTLTELLARIPEQPAGK